MNRKPIVFIRVIVSRLEGPMPTHVTCEDGTSFFLNRRLRKQIPTAKKIYLLEWIGNKHIPQGTIVEGREIWITDLGLVKDENRRVIASYERVVKYGGKSKKEQKIILYLK